MSEPTANPRRRKLLIIQATIGVCLLLAVIFLAWYLRSSQFRRYVRDRITNTLVDVTGGRVEIGSINWNLSKLEFDIHNVTIHGLEDPSDIPYLHADRIYLRAKIRSLASGDIGLHYLQIERPIVHLIVYPDGHTNQPSPKKKGRGEGLQRVFEVAINRAEIKNGELILNQRVLPLDVNADNLQAGVQYEPATRRYDGKLAAANIRTGYGSFLPIGARAKVAFSLYPNRVVVSSSRLEMTKSYVETTGEVANFANPVVKCTYKTHLDAAEIGNIANVPELRGGDIDLAGSSTYSGADFSSSGTLTASRLEYVSKNFRLSKTDGSGDFLLNTRHFLLRNLNAQLAGGKIRGEIAINDWANTGNTKQKRAMREGALQQGTAHLQVSSVPVSAVAEAINSRRLPVARLHLAGLTSGNVAVRWKGSLGQAIADIDLGVTPAEQLSTGELPVSAAVKGTYSVGEARLTLPQLTVSTPGMHLNGSGTLGTSTGNIQLALNVSDLSELEPMLAAFNSEQAGTVAKMRGHASFKGEIVGRLNAPNVIGVVQANDLVLPLRDLSPSETMRRIFGEKVGSAEQPSENAIELDSLRADLRLSDYGIVIRNGSVRRGRMQASLDANAGLDDGELTDASPVSAHLNMQNEQISEIQDLLGSAYPISGVASATLQIGGTRGNPEAVGRIQVANANIYGEPFRSVSSAVQLADNQVRLTHVQLAHDGGQVTGTAEYNMKDASFEAQLSGTNLDLANVRTIQTPRLKIGGLLNFSAALSGTEDEPVLNSEMTLRELSLNGERAGNVDVTAVTRGDRLQIAARSNLQNAELSADGSIQLRGQYPGDLTMRFSHLDIDALLATITHARVTSHSSVDGTVTASGLFLDPKQLRITGEIPQFNAGIESIELRNQDPIRFQIQDQAIKLEEVHVVGTDTELKTSGTIGLAGEKPLNLNASGRFNLKLIQSLRPELRSTGLAEFNARVVGTMSQPLIRGGQAHVTNGSLYLADVPNGLSEINGTLLFNQDRMQVQKLTARTGGGNIEVTGYASYRPELTFNFTSRGNDVRLRYQGISTSANTELHLSGTLTDSTITGNITITRLSTTAQFDLANYLAKSKGSAEAPNPDSPANNIHLDIHVSSTPDLQLQTQLAKLGGDVDLRLRGTAERPVVLGQVNVNEGQINFNGTTYRVERGEVDFNNPVRIEPILDVQATTRISNTDVTLGAHGPIDHLNLTYRSDPPLPTSDIINLLAFHTTREETVASTGGVAQPENVSNAVLGQAVNSVVSSRVQRLFGGSSIRVSPQIGTTENNNMSTLTIEQQVSGNIRVTYIQNLNQPTSSQQAIVVEYTINPSVSVVAGRDLFGIASVDVRIRARKR